MVRLLLSRVIEWVKVVMADDSLPGEIYPCHDDHVCYGDDFDMTYSHYKDDGVIVRRFVVLKCNICGEEYKMYRWAFMKQAGALSWYYGKDYDYRQDEEDVSLHPPTAPGMFLIDNDGRWKNIEEEEIANEHRR